MNTRLYCDLPGDPIRTGVARVGYRPQTDEFGVDSIRRRVCRAVERVDLSLGLLPVVPPSPASEFGNSRRKTSRFKCAGLSPVSVTPSHTVSVIGKLLMHAIWQLIEQTATKISTEIDNKKKRT
jgi:hypothetical protein